MPAGDPPDDVAGLVVPAGPQGCERGELALDGGALPAGTAVNLRAWDVRVLAAEPEAPAEK